MMNVKRTLCLATGLLLLGALAAPARAAEVDCGAVYCFSGADFSGDDTLAGIWVTALPEADQGTVRLGQRQIRVGDVLTAGQLAEMTFDPALSDTDRTATLSYLPIYPDRVDAPETVAIAVLGKTNEAPVAQDSTLETYKNLPNEAQLRVTDPEGEAMTYTLLRQPRRGEVTLREDGSFLYTPKKNKVGTDSFTYTATDASGNVSREATVTVTVLKTDTASQYQDTAGESCRFAAEWMKNTGIFTSESMGGNSCFQPEKAVTRGEFLTMLVGALEIPLEDAPVSTGFTDEAPQWLTPYLAAAMRCGLTDGWPEADTFCYDRTITCAEAAQMLRNALSLTAQASGADSAAWAEDPAARLTGEGVLPAGEEPLTRGEAALVLYRAATGG